MKKIVLVGYMGVGKSTLGKLLAQRLQLEFLDLDDVIEKRTGKTILDIFQSDGEIYFRKLEHEILKTLILNNNSFVLSLGGGTPCYGNNHEFLQQVGVESFYLKASINTLFNRLKNNISSRPILLNQSEEVLKDFIAKQLFERSYYYYQSKKTLEVDRLNPEEIVVLIENNLT